MQRPPSKSLIRIGIWCAYHVTLEASEGIGVFAHNLARGLASLDQPVEVVMLTKIGEEHVMQATVAAGQGRISAVAAKPLSRRARRRQQLAWRIHRVTSKLASLCSARFDRASSRTWQHVQSKVLTALGITTEHYSPRTVRRFRLLVLPVALGVMLVNRAYRIVLGELKDLLCYLAHKSNRIFCKTETRTEADICRIIDSCDVWVVPYVGLARTFNKPVVVTIHDLVCYHYPETMQPGVLKCFMQTAEKVANQATVAACMSNFIRDNDLIGVLNLPEHKIRVVQPAVPTDFGVVAGEEAEVDFPVLKSKYILYPAAFRAYKNHELLVEAFRRLQAAGEHDLQLVLTGIHETPPKLSQLIQECGVSHRVHILGKVSREVLARLYQRAFATIVPSFYEQGSFPLMEAMFWGSPIACSNIPSLVELFAPMGNSMMFFDPKSPEQLTAVIRDLLAQRERILAKQQATRDLIFGRTWTDAANDWLLVFEDAICLAAQSNTTTVESLVQQCRAA